MVIWGSSALVNVSELLARTNKLTNVVNEDFMDMFGLYFEIINLKNMDIRDLTLGQIQDLQKMFGHSCEKRDEGFYVNFHGDSSVGIQDAEWKITGGFHFEDDEELEEFRRNLAGT